MVIPPAGAKLERLNPDKVVGGLSAQKGLIKPTEVQGEVEINWLVKDPSFEAVQIAQLVEGQGCFRSNDEKRSLRHLMPGRLLCH